uniref:Apple domain-containing protein n=1 Tax=Onchocerca flexuosa TaxID=387005 RepID=A0A183HF33_9BILA
LFRLPIIQKSTISDEDEQKSTTIRLADDENKFIIPEATTPVHDVLLPTTTTTITTTISNAETMTKNADENDSFDSITIPTTTFINTILIRDIQLPNRTVLHQSFADEASPLWIYLQKMLEKDIPAYYHSRIATNDNDDKRAMNNPRILNNNVNSESKVRFLEDIVHELRENPNKYKLSVERFDDHQSWLVIRIGNYYKPEEMYKRAIFTDIPERMHAEFPVKHDSSEGNYHILHIKFPYKLFLNNSTLNGTEIQQQIPHADQQSISGIDPKRLNNDESFEKLPEKYIDHQHGYLYHVKIHDITRNIPFINDSIIGHGIRHKEDESRTIDNMSRNIIETKTSSEIDSSCFGMLYHQQLHNASYKTLYDVSLEQCRCACATTMDIFDNDCTMRCKSFQYSDVTRKCLLNEDDHNGKFD